MNEVDLRFAQMDRLADTVMAQEQRIGNLEFQVRNLHRLLDRRAEHEREMQERGA